MVVDWLIVTVVVTPVMVLGFGIREVAPGDGWEAALFVTVAIAVIGFWRYCGATPGKLALGMKVVDAKTGEAPATWRLALRFFGYFLSAFPLYLGFLWAIVDRRKQGWHDKIARTIVINSED